MPDQPGAIFSDLLAAITHEFTTSFGGCTVVPRLEGHYYSAAKNIVSEGIILVYSDSNFDFDKNRQSLGEYADELRDYALNALEEEKILVCVWPVYHPE